MSSVKNKRVGGDVNKQPYRSSRTAVAQLRTPTERDVTSNMEKPESEFVKPYASPSYEEMEYDFIEPWDMLPFDPLTFWDTPFGVPDFDESTIEYFPGRTSDYTFFCGIQPCWCPGQALVFAGKCTYEITSVEWSPGSDPGVGWSVSHSGGNIIISAPVDAPDFKNPSIDIFMRAPHSSGEPGRFVYGSHIDILVGKCIPSSECCNCSEETPTISYTTQSMEVDDEQNLGVADAGSLGGGCFTWSLSGGGSLSDTSGSTTTYTAPSSNEDCDDNPTITLLCSGEVVDTLQIGVSETGFGDNVAYWYTSGCCNPCHCNAGHGPAYICHNDGTPGYCANVYTYRCNGTIISRQASYSGDFGGVPADDFTYSLNCTSLAGTLVDWAGSGCDAVLYLLSTFGGYPGFDSVSDQRTAQMITDGCCPGALI